MSMRTARSIQLSDMDAPDNTMRAMLPDSSGRQVAPLRIDLRRIRSATRRQLIAFVSCFKAYQNG